jgi:hypothetical protein
MEHVCLACHAYSVFKVLSISGQKKKGLALGPDPLLIDLSTLRREPQGANPKGLAKAMGKAWPIVHWPTSHVGCGCNSTADISAALG